MTTFNLPITYVSVPCCRCGIHFGLPEDFNDARRNDGRRFRCPNGHKLSYPKKGEDPAEVEERRAKLLEIHEAEQREAREADTKAVQPDPFSNKCPHCNRSFSSRGWLNRHLRRNHVTA